jgi:dihydrodipicolinate reductase
MDRIKVGVNGYGVIGKRVADAVHAQPDMQLSRSARGDRRGFPRGGCRCPPCRCARRGWRRIRAAAGRRIGYGVIGKRVADAVHAQPDMQLTGVADIVTDWRIQSAVPRLP